jgi:hypothetical protein
MNIELTCTRSLKGLTSGTIHLTLKQLISLSRYFKHLLNTGATNKTVRGVLGKQKLRANIVAVTSNEYNCNALAKDRVEQDDKNSSPEGKV